jgi:hypothetical protein
MTGLRTLGLLGLLYALGSCVAPRTEGVECVFSRDCAQGLICAGSRCRIQCADARDCMAPNVCVASGEGTQNSCLPPAEPRPCSADSHCPTTTRCVMKTCRWTCRTDADCQAQRSGSCDLGTGTCSLPVRAADNVAPTDGGVESDAAMEAAVDVGADSASIDGTSDVTSDATVDADPSMDVAACPAGFADCDGIAANGCESNLQTDPANCGRCGMGCGIGANSTRACAAGMCTLNCTTGFGNCDGDDRTGCETDITGSRAHCGRCANACPAGSFCAPVGGMGGSVCQAADFPLVDAGGPFVPDAGFVPAPDGGGDGGVVVTTLPLGRNVFASVTIPADAVIRSASGELEIFADGPIRIDGTIDVSGGRGSDSVPTRPTNLECRQAGQGGGTGTTIAGVATVGMVCPTAALGGSGATGSQPMPTAMGCSLGGAFGGGSGAAGAAVRSPATSVVISGGGGGGGYAGGGGGGVRISGQTVQVIGGAGASAGGARGGLGGGGADAGFAGHGGEPNVATAIAMYAGRAGATTGFLGGGGGGSIGEDAARDLEVRSTFRAGSGGGGGAIGSCSSGEGGGAGGGGGGGALRIVSNTSIELGPTARLLAVGGAGGDGLFVSRSGAGGGSGGLIFLSAPRVTVESTAIVDVRGGPGGSGMGIGGVGGGNGGLGRIRIAVLPRPGFCALRGSFFPGFATGTACEISPAGGVPGRVFVGTFPAAM